ncbi:MAG TPA: hypothetical protein VNM40_01865 [Candidatus Paceibacterota bacterium]|nr:hypothetical protein [Candidatus Paceibacterota bacterium]
MALLQNKMVLMIVVGILVAGVVWYSFLRDRGTGELLQTDNLTEATEADRDIVNTLLELRAVSLSGTIFSDPAFLRLKDFGSQIIPEPVGRPNPFAPFQGQAVVGAAAAGTQATSSASAPR